MNYQARDFATLQLELIDTKVNMAATTTMNQVIEQIRALKDEIHEMRSEMNIRFAIIETKLGIFEERRSKILDHTLEYIFKAGWTMGIFVLSYALLKFHITIST